MIELSKQNELKIREYLTTVLPESSYEDDTISQSIALALEALEVLRQDMQDSDFKNKEYYKYSKAYLILNYLDWLVTHYSLEDLKEFVTTKHYYDSASLEQKPSSCIIGAAFNNPSTFPVSLNSEVWGQVKEAIVSGAIVSGADDEFLILDEGKVSNFLNVLPVLLLDGQAVRHVQFIHDNHYYLRTMIQSLLEDYLQECMFE